MNEWNKRKFYQNPISKDLPLIDHFQYKEKILKDQLKQHLPDHFYQNDLHHVSVIMIKQYWAWKPFLKQNLTF